MKGLRACEGWAWLCSCSRMAVLQLLPTQLVNQKHNEDRPTPQKPEAAIQGLLHPRLTISSSTTLVLMCAQGELEATPSPGQPVSRPQPCTQACFFGEVVQHRHD
jgi:hypothetical protein